MSEGRSVISSRGARSMSNVSVPEAPATTINMEMYDFTRHPMIVGLGDSVSEKTDTSIRMVICRVCESKIPLDGYDLDEHFIVKCSHCKEATPIKSAPHGERYVRCACGCLLICKTTAGKVACPRMNCQRVITVVNDPKQTEAARETASTASRPPPGTFRLTCAHCQQPFIFNITHKSLTKCPTCGRISAFQDEHYRDMLRRSFGLSLTIFIMTILIIFVNSIMNQRFAGEVALYLMLVAITILASVRPILALRLKTSRVDEL